MKKATIVFEYENETCNCMMDVGDVPITSLYEMVSELKKRLEYLMAEDVNQMGFKNNKAANDFLKAKYEFEQMKLNE